MSCFIVLILMGGLVFGVGKSKFFWHVVFVLMLQIVWFLN